MCICQPVCCFRRKPLAEELQDSDITVCRQLYTLKPAFQFVNQIFLIQSFIWFMRFLLFDYFFTLIKKFSSIFNVNIINIFFSIKYIWILHNVFKFFGWCLAFCRTQWIFFSFLPFVRKSDFNLLVQYNTFFPLRL